MLHLVKMAAGVRDLEQLRARQSGGGRVLHHTRNMPKRAAEILDGGSIYWIFAGAIGARQRIDDIQESQYPDGSRCAVLVLDPEIIPVLPTRKAPIQGWRYAEAEQVPRDLDAPGAATGIDQLPPKMQRELRELCLI